MILYLKLFISSLSHVNIVVYSKLLSQLVLKFISFELFNSSNKLLHERVSDLLDQLLFHELFIVSFKIHDNIFEVSINNHHSSAYVKLGVNVENNNIAKLKIQIVLFILCVVYLCKTLYINYMLNVNILQKIRDKNFYSYN